MGETTFTFYRDFQVYFSMENRNFSEKKKKELMEFSTKPKAFSLRSYMFYIEFPPKQTGFFFVSRLN